MLLVGAGLGHRLSHGILLLHGLHLLRLGLHLLGLLVLHLLGLLLLHLLRLLHHHGLLLLLHHGLLHHWLHLRLLCEVWLLLLVLLVNEMRFGTIVAHLIAAHLLSLGGPPLAEQAADKG